jgi:hypothetical protein
VLLFFTLMNELEIKVGIQSLKYILGTQASAPIAPLYPHQGTYDLKYFSWVANYKL